MKWVLFCACSGAAIWDLQTRKIPNFWLALSFCAAFGAGCFLEPRSFLEWTDAAIASIVTAVLLWKPWRLRMIGAGDLKLLILLAGYLSWRDYVICLTGTVLAAGLFSALSLLGNRNGRERLLCFAEWLRRCTREGAMVPYMERKDYSKKNTIPLAAAVWLGYVAMVFGA